jgi:hypothetical protein
LVELVLRRQNLTGAYTHVGDDGQFFACPVDNLLISLWITLWITKTAQQSKMLYRFRAARAGASSTE